MYSQIVYKEFWQHHILSRTVSSAVQFFQPVSSWKKTLNFKETSHSVQRLMCSSLLVLMVNWIPHVIQNNIILMFTISEKSWEKFVQDLAAHLIISQ